MSADDILQAAVQGKKEEKPVLKKTISGMTVKKPTQVVEHLKMLLYGGNGSGKSPMAATAANVADLSPVLYLDIEGGSKSIARLDLNLDNISIIDFKDSNGILMEEHKLFHKFKEVVDELKSGEHGYKTVIVDSGTKLNYYNAEMLIHHPKQGHFGFEGTLSMAGWGQNLADMKRAINDLMVLPMNVIWVGHPSIPDDNDQKIRPTLPGKQLNIAYPMDFDMIFYLSSLTINDKTTKGLRTMENSKILARSRVGNFPEVITDSPETPLNMQTIYDYLKPNINKEK